MFLLERCCMLFLLRCARFESRRRPNVAGCAAMKRKCRVVGGVLGAAPTCLNSNRSRCRLRAKLGVNLLEKDTLPRPGNICRHEMPRRRSCMLLLRNGACPGAAPAVEAVPRNAPPQEAYAAFRPARRRPPSFGVPTAAGEDRGISSRCRCSPGRANAGRLTRCCWKALSCPTRRQVARYAAGDACAARWPRQWRLGARRCRTHRARSSARRCVGSIISIPMNAAAATASAAPC